MDAITANDFDEFLARAGIAMLDPAIGSGKQLSFKPGPARIIVVHFVESDRPKYLLDMTARILDLEETWLLAPRRGTAADLELLDGSQPDKAVRFAAAQRSRLAEYLCIRPMAFGNYSMDIFVIAGSGNTLITWDHHTAHEGLGIELRDKADAGRPLVALNDLGAELDLIGREQQAGHLSPQKIILY